MEDEVADGIFVFAAAGPDLVVIQAIQTDIDSPGQLRQFSDRKLSKKVANNLQRLARCYSDSMLLRLIFTAVLTAVLALSADGKVDYRVLATSKTSTMEKELNQAAADGFVFGGVMGGESAFGGSEVITVMAKNAASPSAGRKYKLVAASKTSTMQKELNQAGEEGFFYCGQTVFSSTFGGKEVAVILEFNPDSKAGRIVYKLAATSKTSTMEKELRQAGEEGFKFLGVVVGKTAFGGSELISILYKSEK